MWPGVIWRWPNYTSFVRPIQSPVRRCHANILADFYIFKAAQGNCTLLQKNRSNHTKAWLAEDIEQMADLIASGRSIPEMANILGRSQEAVRTRANDLNLLPKRARRKIVGKRAMVAA